MLTIMHTEASVGWGGQELRILSEATAFAKRGFRLLIACQPRSRVALEAQRCGLSVRPVAMPRAFDATAWWKASISCTPIARSTPGSPALPLKRCAYRWYAAGMCPSR